MTYTCGIFLIDSRNKVLACHITNQPRHGRFWSIPKGLPDDGEEHIDAALRELMEETGIEISKESLVPLKLSKYYSASMKKPKTLVPYMAKLVRSGEEIECECHSYFENKSGCLQPEVDAFEWVNLDVAELMLHGSQIPALSEIKTILNYQDAADTN